MIEYRDVGMTYGDNVILKQINLTINDGELFVLVGPSGSGKTTLLRMINRLTEPTHGDVYLDGKRVKDHDLRQLRLHMGYVLQTSSLFPNLTVGDNITIQLEEAGVKKAERKKRALALLAQVGLEGDKYISRLPKELSGGQQQRVLLARALCATRSMLLLDEPTAGLDPKATAELYQLIARLNHQDGITVIMISHDLTAALDAASHILHIGQTVFFGTADAYRTSPEGRLFAARKGGAAQ